MILGEVADELSDPLLLDDGCHYGQGFGYAPALPAQEAEVYLNESLADGAAPIKARSV